MSEILDSSLEAFLGRAIGSERDGRITVLSGVEDGRLARHCMMVTESQRRNSSAVRLSALMPGLRSRAGFIGVWQGREAMKRGDKAPLIIALATPHNAEDLAHDHMGDQ